MLKKPFLIFIFTTLLFFYLPFTTLGADITADLSIEDNVVTVSGYASSGEWVTITIHKENGKTAYLGQTRADNDGLYSFLFTLDQGEYSGNIVCGTASTASDTITVSTDFDGDSGNTPNNPKPGENNNSTAKCCYIKVTGSSDYGTILPQTSWVWNSGSPDVITVLREVLDDRNISCVITAGGYVKSIDGLSEKAPGYPLSGWIYKVNGDSPPVGAESCTVHNGDRIEWLYTLDGNPGSQITWGSGLITDESSLKQQMETYISKLNALGLTPVLLNQEQSMTLENALHLKNTFVPNRVSLTAEVGSDGAFLYDSTGEFMLLIPEDALKKNTTLTVKEKTDIVNQGDIKICSGIYDIQPEGTVFINPIYIAIPIAITEDIDFGNITPARYDTEAQQWIPMPGIIDLENGWVVFKAEHLCDFAVIQTVPPRDLVRISFPDLGPEYEWARDAVEIMAGQGIIQGTNLGFEPQRNINRAEMAQLLVNISQLIPAGSGREGFSDVKESEWFAAAVAAAADAEMINGYPDGTFKPYAPVTRNEIAVILYRLQNADGTLANQGVSGTFTDHQNIPAWAHNGVSFVKDCGLMNGYGDGSFQGVNPLTRAEAAVILYRYLQLAES